MIKYPLNVTIDTNVFEAKNFGFSTDETFRILINYIHNKRIKLFLSDIVIKEIENHITQRASKLCGKLRKQRNECLSELPEQYLKEIGLGSYIDFPDKGKACQSAKDLFHKFLNDCSVEILDASIVDIAKIVDDYFDARPPFENSERKKNEFPDAIIAEEINKHFGTEETIAIVSNDKGLINACSNSKNHLCYQSLESLFDELSKQEKGYNNALKLIVENREGIKKRLQNEIDDSCIELHGLSYDRDGVESGYDYDESYLNDFNITDLRLHTIDEIDESTIKASLWISCSIEVDCYFDDYDNACWDPEEKEYLFVEQRHFLEKHNSKFACRVSINSDTKEIEIMPFKVVLGGDSRISIEERFDSEE